MQAGRAEVRGVIERARERLAAGGRRTIFFLDEIHRFNKAQQDALLPAVEEGLVTLIGATTENPYFEVNSALLSRARVYELEPLIAGAGAGAARSGGGARGVRPGLAGRPGRCSSSCRARPGGDARTALNALELACQTAGPDGAVGLAHAEDALQRRALLYDRQADRHYDTISAWIKATRGSDPDASLYYLAVMLEGGEDPRFIVRRMVVLASEDIGNADPQRAGGGDRGGRGGRARRHARVLSSRWRRPRSTCRWRPSPMRPSARSAPREGSSANTARRSPPAYLRSSTRSDGGYDYPHARPGHVSPQELMPDPAIGQRFYEPDDAEAALRERLEEIRRARGRSLSADSLGRMYYRDSHRSARIVQPRHRRARSARSRPLRPRMCRPSWTPSPRCSRRGAADAEERGAYCERVAQVVLEESDEIRDLIVREQGKPRNEAFSMELLPTIDALGWIAQRRRRDPGRREGPDAAGCS